MNALPCLLKVSHRFYDARGVWLPSRPVFGVVLCLVLCTQAWFLWSGIGRRSVQRSDPLTVGLLDSVSPRMHGSVQGGGWNPPLDTDCGGRCFFVDIVEYTV